MSRSLSRFPVPARIALLGFVVFAVLAVRFSPNWYVYWRDLRDVKTTLATASPPERDAIEKALLGAYSERGYFVLQQARDLNAEIPVANHKIVRWRLLFPALGRWLHLPGWVTLGLAQAGCFFLVLALAAIGWRGAGGDPVQAASLAIVAGATAPFFTSMGWLGYYDSWLALGLLAVAFARTRWIVMVACLLTPWVDERFVIGLPLALLVRWLAEPRAPGTFWQWTKTEAILPVALAGAYALVRLQLGGTGSSQTVGQYLHEFVFSHSLTPGQRLYGAWEGLRAGWLLVGGALWWCGQGGGPGRRWATLLGVAVAGVSLAGLFTALDLSRSAVLVLPVVPLGWSWAVRQAWWQRAYVAPALSLVALVWPARQIIASDRQPVDAMWSYPTELAHALNNLGTAYQKGAGLKPDQARVLALYRRAAAHGDGTAETNLGVIYNFGRGVEKDLAEAARLYRLGAEHGSAEGEFNLGTLYDHGALGAIDNVEAARWYRRAADRGLLPAIYAMAMVSHLGQGVPQDEAEAVRWFRQAAERGYAPAQHDLGVRLANGVGVAKNEPEAAKWFALAAAQGMAEAQFDLGYMFAEGRGTAVNLVEAWAWWAMAAAGGNEKARQGLKLLEGKLTADQIARGQKIAQDRLALLRSSPQLQQSSQPQSP